MRTCFLYFIFTILAYQRLNANRDLHQFQNKNSSAFEENKGQVLNPDHTINDEIVFFLNAKDISIFIRKDGISYQLNRTLDSNQKDSSTNMNPFDYLNKSERKVRLETHRVDMKFEGANSLCEIVPYEQSTDYVNYYTHNVLKVKFYKKLIIKNIYPNIDWILKIQNNRLKSEFIVNANAEPNLIKMKYSGHSSLSSDENHNLIIGTLLGNIVESSPVSIQNARSISTRYQVVGNTVSFKIGHYVRKSILVIDPNISWSTYYSNKLGFSNILIDKSNNVYVAGQTSTLTGLAYLGFQMSIGGGSHDALLIKFGADGTRKWATYYGGSLYDGVLGIALDNKNNITICGETESTTNIAYQGYMNSKPSFSNSLGFYATFDSSGTRILGSYYGGRRKSGIYTCAYDLHNNFYIGGSTSSDTMIAINGYRNTYNDSFDAFLVKFDSTGVNRIWGTYFGGNRLENIASIAVDSLSNIYFGGSTLSNSQISMNGFQNILGGDRDGFIGKFSLNGSLIWSSYYGGLEFDVIGCLKLSKGSIYAIGLTYSTAQIASNGFMDTIHGANDLFLLKLDTSGSRTWATYYGGTSNEANGNLSIDKRDNIYLIGSTSSSDYIGYRGMRNTLMGDDVLLAKFRADGSRIWGSYYGGSGVDYGSSIVVNSKNEIYITGRTFSSSGIALNGFQNSCISCGGGNSFLSKLTCNRDTTLYDTICLGDTMVFNGIQCNLSGTYLDTLETWDICDSFITLNLKVNRRDTTHFYDTICQGSSHVFNGQNCTATGIYWDTLMNNENCDSFILLHLLVHRLDTTHIYDTSCGNVPRVWNGFNLTSSGVYLDTLLNRFGCDSFLLYHYIPKNPSRDSPIISICEGTSYIVGSKSYTSSGTYRDTLKNIQGCDSIVSLILTVRDTSSKSWTASICQGSHFVFSGDSLRKAGTYRDTLKNANGCDSFLTLTLVVNGLGSKIIIDTICPNKTYPFDGKMLSSSGIYRDTLKSKNGCDSIVTLNLWVRPKKLLSLVDSNSKLIATKGFSLYRWYRNGLDLKLPNLNFYFPIQSGTYKVEVTEQNGCRYFSDSVLVQKIGVLNATQGELFEVFPIPTSETLYIQRIRNFEKDLQVSIFTFDGRKLIVPIQKISNALYSISTSSLQRGIYMIELKTNRITELKKFEVE